MCVNSQKADRPRRMRIQCWMRIAFLTGDAEEAEQQNGGNSTEPMGGAFRKRPSNSSSSSESDHHVTNNAETYPDEAELVEQPQAAVG